jgi:hypothetical protein
MTETPVVIKINYANKSIPKAHQPTEVITEWHIPRIVGALSILLALIVWIWPNDTNESQSVVTAELDTRHEVEKQPLTLPVISEAPKASQAPNVAEPVKATTQPPKAPQNAENPVYRLETNKPAAVIYDRHVLRAALVAEIKDQKPGPRLQPNITLTDAGHQELFYFTEIKHPTQTSYVHQWFKNGQQVLKKNLPVKGDLTQLISSKKLSLKDKGVWSVVLLDNKGKALSESRFVVN